MSRKDDELPPLPHQVRFAIQAFRQVKPDEDLERRVFDAVKAAGSKEEGADRAKEAPARRGSLTFVLATAGGIAALVVGVYGLTLAGRADQHPAGGPRELAVTLTDDEHTWVELPVSAHHGERPTSAVYLDTPASIVLRLHTPEEPHAPSTVCTEHRCVHRWTPVASSKMQAVPHLRIREPGRYEVTVTHVSHDKSHRQDFVIHAKR